MMTAYQHQIVLTVAAAKAAWATVGAMRGS